MIVSDSTDSRLPTPLDRVARVIRALCYLAALAGLVWLAATRWNGVPADRSGPAATAAMMTAGSVISAPIDPARDRTGELLAALEALPPEPPLTLPPPPEGMRWKTTPRWPIDVRDTLCGEWTTEGRPNLQAVVAYLNTPALEAAMSQIAAVEPGGWRPFGPKGLGLAGMRVVRDAASLFVGRARYRHAALGDMPGALADLEAAYRFAAINYDSGELIGILVALACEGLAYTELRSLAREHSLSQQQAARIISAIRTTTLTRQQMWTYVVEASVGELQRQLDMSYTDDGEGNGWLVLSHLETMTGPTWSARRRCGAWNILSPLFNDRRTVSDKIATLRERYEQVGNLPYGQAKAVLEANWAQTVFGITDGPLAFSGGSAVLPTVLDAVMHKVAARRAAILAVALSAYRGDHGQYPSSLDRLLEEYLDQLPLDPCNDQPWHYVHQEDGSYLLYSVGSNLRDDGGCKRTIDPKTGRVSGVGDWVYSRPRPDPHYEPELVKVKP